MAKTVNLLHTTTNIQEFTTTKIK